MLKSKLPIVTAKKYLIALDDEDANIAGLKSSPNIEVIQDFNLSVRWRRFKGTIFAFNDDGIAAMQQIITFNPLPYHYVASKCGYLFIISKDKFYQHEVM